MNEIIEWGKLAGSVSAIIGLATLIFWKPISKARQRANDEKKASQSFRSTVLEKLDGIGDDVGDLQCDRLNQAHDYYVAKGFCATEKKALLCDMYKSYHGKGRNHLSEHYEKDIMSLPDKPKGD